MEDYVVRATSVAIGVRAFASVTTNMVKTAKEIHDLFPTSAAALGRTLSAAAMMAGMLKGEMDTITIQIKGDGPLGGMVVITDSNANVRGYVHNPHVDLPLNSVGKLDVSGAVGKNGYLNVIKDLGLKEPYVGYVNLISGEIGEDVAYYFACSEQVPSIVALGVYVDNDGSILASGGYIIQLMPGAEDNLIDFLERKIHAVPSVTQLLCEGKKPDDILQLILGEKGLEFNENYVCRYACNCSRERMERNMLSLGKKDLLEIINEQHGAEVCCHFCNSKYQFSEKELLALVDDR